ncbi:MAG: hypothetical protein AAFY33_02325 [Cyanobacteria bacterium J06643_4]
MMDTVSLTIDWRSAASELPDSQQEALTQTLYRELRALDEIETVSRVADPALPNGAMGAQWLWSVLTAEIPGEGLKNACQEVFIRLAGQPMELTIEVEGQAQKIDAKNVRPDDFDAVVDKLVEAAQKMKAAQPPSSD